MDLLDETLRENAVPARMAHAAAVVRLPQKEAPKAGTQYGAEFGKFWHRHSGQRANNSTGVLFGCGVAATSKRKRASTISRRLMPRLA
jgi:hypothetical protein